MTAKDVVNNLEGVVQNGRFAATPESTAILKEQALLVKIHAQIVSISPSATVKIKDGIVTLSNLDSKLKHDEAFRQKTAKRLIQAYGLKNVVYAKSVKAKTDYINPLYNLE